MECRLKSVTAMEADWIAVMKFKDFMQRCYLFDFLVFIADELKFGFK